MNWSEIYERIPLRARVGVTGIAGAVLFAAGWGSMDALRAML